MSLSLRRRNIRISFEFKQKRVPFIVKEKREINHFSSKYNYLKEAKNQGMLFRLSRYSFPKYDFVFPIYKLRAYEHRKPYKSNFKMILSSRMVTRMFLSR